MSQAKPRAPRLFPLPRSRHLSAAEIARLKAEHEETLGAARTSAIEAAALERRLSDLVNEAYKLTPDDVRLMWQTAPPRMPFQPSAALHASDAP
jgi:hypothetical protein